MASISPLETSSCIKKQSNLRMKRCSLTFQKNNLSPSLGSFLQNSNELLPDCMVPHPKRHHSSYSPSQEPPISHNLRMFNIKSPRYIKFNIKCSQVMQDAI